MTLREKLRQIRASEAEHARLHPTVKWTREERARQREAKLQANLRLQHDRSRINSNSRKAASRRCAI